MSYEYVSQDCSNQYLDTPVSGRIVKARYLPSSIRSERGKRLIEALPLPRIESSEWQTAYTVPLPDYQWDPSKSKLQKFKEIWQLRNVRFPLPFAGEIEREFHRSLTDSYCSRYLSESEKGNDIWVNDRMILQGGTLTAEKRGAVVGFSLLGSSQSGKTSAMKILTDWYPQTIEHKLDNGGRFIQIVYLNVECQAHSSMRSMFDAIGHEIDKALGNTESIYETFFRRHRQTISQKEQLLRRLIDTFGIGALILEECQAMNFNSQDEKSFEAFLTLCNETGIALIMIGTEDARKKMFGHAARTAHRVGPEIKSDLYCRNGQFLATLISRLFHYQWFDENVLLTSEMAEALIQYSHGIIGLLIRIYIYMNIDYIAAIRKPNVDAAYVQETAQRHFKEIIRLLESNAGKQAVDEECQKAFETLNKNFAEAINSEERQEENTRKLTEASEELEEIAELKAFLTERCLDDEDYDPEVLSRIIDKAIQEGTITQVSRREAYRMIRKVLKETKQKTPPNKERQWSAEAKSSAPSEPFDE